MSELQLSASATKKRVTMKKSNRICFLREYESNEKKKTGGWVFQKGHAKSIKVKRIMYYIGND